jgi:hypothetical protein
MGDFTAAQFQIDAIEGSFAGYTNGDTWNGWACPYFLRPVAEAVLGAAEANGYFWTYDVTRDVFSVRNQEDPAEYESEEYVGTDIVADGETCHVYGIGAYSWIWETEARDMPA